MQTFKTDRDAVFWTADDGEWVEAHVAQGLYDALEHIKFVHNETLAPNAKLAMDMALAAADGEEV